MRVGLDLIYLVPGETGGRETYARELVAAMVKREPSLQLVAFLGHSAPRTLAAELGAGVEGVRLPVSARSRAQWAVGELALVAGAARRARVELVHAMANFGPPWGPFRRVLTVHDVYYRAVPQTVPALSRAATHALVWAAARGADRVIAVSSSGRDEIVAGLGVPGQRVDVIPNGVRRPDTDTAIAPNCPAAAPLRERSARRVALSVASNLPHKNLAVLTQALAQFDAADRPLLVFAGHGTDDGSLGAAAARAGVHDDVVTLGACTLGEIEWLYAHADCLLLPTLHEGFGLPVLEALVRSLPVACSDISALHELAGDAAVYFDPQDPSTIRTALARVLTDKQLTGRLCEEGLRRAQRFSWDAAAAATLDCYRRVLATPRASNPLRARLMPG